MKRTKVVAFAEDLIIATRGESVRAVENYVNVELSKINVWAKNNKTRFKDKKSKVMIVSRRKRKENKNITVYLNNKQLDQVTKMKYLGIILDHKFRFNEHKIRCREVRKTNPHLIKSGKNDVGNQTRGYGYHTQRRNTTAANIRRSSMDRSNEPRIQQKEVIRVQRLINISMAKAYRTTSSEALCMLTATTPIIIKLEEIVKRYNTKKRRSNSLMELDHEVEYKYWPHPADTVTIEEVVSDEEATLQAFTDGSKQEQGVGAGAVVFKGSELVAKVQMKLDNRCSNNQAEQLAILKVLETIESMNSLSINPGTATIFTDSRVSLDSLHNVNNHAHLAEEIRKKVTSMVRTKWKIKFSWVKAHAGIYGNEMADRLAKEAARSDGTNYGYSRIPISAIYREAAEKAIQKWQEQWTKTS